MSVFMTECRIGSKVKFKNEIRPIVDINRNTREVCIKNNRWIRCTEVELINNQIIKER